MAGITKNYSFYLRAGREITTQPQWIVAMNGCERGVVRALDSSNIANS